MPSVMLFRKTLKVPSSRINFDSGGEEEEDIFYYSEKKKTRNKEMETIQPQPQSQQLQQSQQSFWNRLNYLIHPKNSNALANRLKKQLKKTNQACSNYPMYSNPMYSNPIDSNPQLQEFIDSVATFLDNNDQEIRKLNQLIQELTDGKQFSQKERAQIDKRLAELKQQHQKATKQLNIARGQTQKKDKQLQQMRRTKQSVEARIKTLEDQLKTSSLTTDTQKTKALQTQLAVSKKKLDQLSQKLKQPTGGAGGGIGTGGVGGGVGGVAGGVAGGVGIGGAVQQSIGVSVTESKPPQSDLVPISDKSSPLYDKYNPIKTATVNNKDLFKLRFLAKLTPQDIALLIESKCITDINDDRLKDLLTNPEKCMLKKKSINTPLSPLSPLSLGAALKGGLAGGITGLKKVKPEARNPQEIAAATALTEKKKNLKLLLSKYGIENANLYKTIQPMPPNADRYLNVYLEERKESEIDPTTFLDYWIYNKKRLNPQVDENIDKESEIRMKPMILLNLADTVGTYVIYAIIEKNMQDKIQGEIPSSTTQQQKSVASARIRKEAESERKRLMLDWKRKILFDRYRLETDESNKVNILQHFEKIQKPELTPSMQEMIDSLHRVMTMWRNVEQTRRGIQKINREALVDYYTKMLKDSISMTKQELNDWQKGIIPNQTQSKPIIKTVSSPAAEEVTKLLSTINQQYIETLKSFLIEFAGLTSLPAIITPSSPIDPNTIDINALTIPEIAKTLKTFSVTPEKSSILDNINKKIDDILSAATAPNYSAYDLASIVHSFEELGYPIPILLRTISSQFIRVKTPIPLFNILADSVLVLYKCIERLIMTEVASRSNITDISKFSITQSRRLETQWKDFLSELDLFLSRLFYLYYDSMEKAMKTGYMRLMKEWNAVQRGKWETKETLIAKLDEQEGLVSQYNQCIKKVYETITTLLPEMTKIPETIKTTCNTSSVLTTLQSVKAKIKQKFSKPIKQTMTSTPNATNRIVIPRKSPPPSSALPQTVSSTSSALPQAPPSISPQTVPSPQ